MHYDVINSAIDDIVYIVNQYNKDKEYEVSVCEKLVLTLFGYYLVFGPEIFTKIGKLLDALQIKECENSEECIKEKIKIIPKRKTEFDDFSSTIWQYQYVGEKEDFVGAIPHIVYYKKNLIKDVSSMIHEFSHCLEGVTAVITEETPTSLTIKQGFEEYTITKDETYYKTTGRAMTELITVAIQNRCIQQLINLDPTQITNPMVKDFVGQLSSNKNKNAIVMAYPTMTVLFKDLLDNDEFFELIKRHYYETEQETIIKKFNSYDEKLSFERLQLYAEKVVWGDIDNTIYYSKPIKQQIDIFNEKTSFMPDKRMVFII